VEVRRRLGSAISNLGDLEANFPAGSNIDVERLLEYQLEYGRTGKMCSRIGSAVMVDGIMKIQKPRAV
jgi:hypothetical protein